MYDNRAAIWKIAGIEDLGVKDVRRLNRITLSYVAPELIRSVKERDIEAFSLLPSIDVYACGIIGFELFASRLFLLRVVRLRFRSR